MKSFPVKLVRIEEKLAAKKELHLGFTVDRFNGYYFMLTSKKKINASTITDYLFLKKPLEIISCEALFIIVNRIEGFAFFKRLIPRFTV